MLVRVLNLTYFIVLTQNEMTHVSFAIKKKKNGNISKCYTDKIKYVLKFLDIENAFNSLTSHKNENKNRHSSLSLVHVYVILRLLYMFNIYTCLL